MNYLNQYLFKVNSKFDLRFCICGYEKCHPLKKVGPYSPEFYIFHFIDDGCGSYKVGSKSYNLKKGQGFLIYPNDVCYYKPNPQFPWSYYWIGFQGNQVNSLIKTICTPDRPIFTYNANTKIIIKNIYDLSKKDLPLNLKILQLTSYLYSLIFELSIQFESRSKLLVKQQYLTYAINYISKSYNNSNLTVAEVANHVHVDRTYLFNLFKSAFNISPKQFIINYRMDKAAYFLKNTQLTSKEICYSVGYKDYSLFSRMFKKVKGKSPNNYRQKDE